MKPDLATAWTSFLLPSLGFALHLAAGVPACASQLLTLAHAWTPLRMRTTCCDRIGASGGARNSCLAMFIRHDGGVRCHLNSAVGMPSFITACLLMAILRYTRSF